MTAGGGQSGLHARNYLIQTEFLRGNVADWDVYPFTVPAIRAFDRLILEQPVTFLIGENGSGKSTLLEAIAVAWGLNPEGGSRDLRFTTRASHSDLYKYLRLGRSRHHAGDQFFLRAESFTANVTVRFHSTSNPTANHSWRWWPTASTAAASMCWMNRRPRFPLPGSYRCWR